MKKLYQFIPLIILFSVTGCTDQSGSQYALENSSSNLERKEFSKGHEAYQNEDYATAFNTWKPLAEQGLFSAQYAIADMYADGHGVTQDNLMSAMWFSFAAEQGYDEAQFRLGKMYDIRLVGITQDYKTAIKWYMKAAEQGHDYAQYHLGEMYQYGYGIMQDYTKALMWYEVSVSLGSELADEKRISLAKRMTADDILKANDMARKCVANNFKNC